MGENLNDMDFHYLRDYVYYFFAGACIFYRIWQTSLPRATYYLMLVQIGQALRISLS